MKQSHISRGWGKYCSIECRSKGQLKGKNVNCFLCNKEIYRPPLSIKRSKSGKFFCNKKCQTIWRNKILFIGEKHANWIHGKSAYRRILKASGSLQMCALCNTSDNRVIIVHHIDKNRNNNTISNLIWLCNNCHYLVHHYKEEEKKLKLLIKI